MRSSDLGKNTSNVEVQNISPFGIWIWVLGKEYFLSYEKFPWFKEAKISDIQTVKLQHRSSLHWPALDVDLAIESLSAPEKYPLFYH